MGLDVEGDGDADHALALPCAALEGTRCGVYAHRPGACRAFECRLLRRAERGEIGLEQALGLIADTRKRLDGVRHQIAALGQVDDRLPLKERCADALTLAAETRADDASRRRRRSLEAAMAAVARILETEFLRPL